MHLSNYKRWRDDVLLIHWQVCVAVFSKVHVSAAPHPPSQCAALLLGYLASPPRLVISTLLLIMEYWLSQIYYFCANGSTAPCWPTTANWGGKKVLLNSSGLKREKKIWSISWCLNDKWLLQQKQSGSVSLGWEPRGRAKATALARQWLKRAVCG